MRGGHYIAKMLEAYGVTHVFFVPTILSATLAAMEDHTTIKRVLTHGEKSAAYMADGYARATGRPGICMAQAIGASNLAAGLRDAWLARSPVIAITGTTAPHNRNRNVYQQVNDIDQFRAVTKWAAQVESLGDLPQALHQAFRIATTNSPGPVLLQIPNHFGEIENGDADLNVEVETRFRSVPPYRPRPEPESVREAAKLLAAAEAPIMVAGGGASHSGAGRELVALAERLDIPFATAMNAKSLAPADHRLNVGVLGLYSRESANRTVAEADLVFFIGSGTGSQVTTNWKVPRPGTRVIQLDIDPAEIGRHYFGALPLLGDAKVTLQALIDQPLAAGAPVRRKWLTRVKTLREEWCRQAAAQMGSDAVPIRPERICAELNKVLPSDATVVVDTGHAGMWTAAYLDLNAPDQTFLRAAGSLGWGFPAAIGAKLAAPKRPVVLFTGDGGFWYHVAELETAARLGTELVVVINNNNCLNQERDIYTEAYGGALRGNHHELWHFQHLNFAKLAESMGARGIRVERAASIAPALREALGHSGGPCVVEVVSDPDAMAPMAYTGSPA